MALIKILIFNTVITIIILLHIRSPKSLDLVSKKF